MIMELTDNPMKTMTRKPYIAPELAVVEVCSEKGFANSNIIGLPQDGMLELLIYQNGSGEMETFQEHSTWTEGSDGFWQ